MPFEFNDPCLCAIQEIAEKYVQADQDHQEGSYPGSTFTDFPNNTVNNFSEPDKDFFHQSDLS